MNTRLLGVSFIIGISLFAVAADNQLLCITMDETLEGYMRRLRTDEARDDIPGTFIFQEETYVSCMEDFMEKRGLGGYCEYFKALASTKKLSDAQKVQSCYVEVPPIKAFKEKTKEERHEFVAALMFVPGQCANYSIKRLLVTPLCEFDVNLNQEYHWFACKTLLEWCLRRDDLPLVHKLLQHGADPNIGEVLFCCRSLQAAQLCLKHGANVMAQHAKKDLIKHVCRALYEEEIPPDMLELFLTYVPLNESNGFGRQWFDTLRRQPATVSCDSFFEWIERIAILLKAGCYYDEGQIEGLKDDIPGTCIYSPDVKPDCKGPENLTLALRNRAFTGKPLSKELSNRYYPKYERTTIQNIAIQKINTLVAQDRKRRQNLATSV